MEVLSQNIWQFFETYKNCMTLLWRGHVVVIIITYFYTRKSYIKETAIPDKAMLSLYLSLVVFQLGGLLYRLCYRINFIITSNEGLGLQLLGKNS